MHVSLLDLLQMRCTDASLKLDVGANIGGYTHLMLDHPGQIHAFEAIPQLADEVTRRFADNPRVTVFKAGVSSHEHTRANLAVFEAWTLDTPEHAVRGRNADALARFGDHLFTVEFVTVDAHVDRFNDSVRLVVDSWGDFAPLPPAKVDFIKLDTDGYELRVLKGAVQTLMRDRPPILCEFNYMIQDLGDSIPEFLWTIYQKLNYTVVTDDGLLRDQGYWLEHYPYHTSFDVGLIPVERLREFGF